jgi:predicted nucleic acid-binding protein
MATPRKLLVVDTTIISHALAPKQTQAYTELFAALEKNYKFVVSGFTKFELLRTSDKEHREKYLIYLKQDMLNIDLSPVLMDFSARVNFVYTKHPDTKNMKLTDGDVINAALAMIKGCPVLTHDSLDYPAPFFKEIDRKEIKYQSSRNRDVVEMVYLQEPHMKHIKLCFEEHEV